MGDQTVGLQARLMSQALRKLAGNLNRANTVCLFTNQIREKVGVMFGSPGDPARRPGAQVLRLAAHRHPPHRDAQGGHRGGRQPRAREDRQEQGRAAVPPGRVRHRVRRRHLLGGLPDRPRHRARHRPEVGRLLQLRRRAARPGPQQRQGVPARERRRSRTRSRRRSTRRSGSSARARRRSLRPREQPRPRRARRPSPQRRQTAQPSLSPRWPRRRQRCNGRPTAPTRTPPR